MRKQTEPIIIIAGTPYPGAYKKEVFEHLAAKLAEEVVERKRFSSRNH